MVKLNLITILRISKTDSVSRCIVFRNITSIVTRKLSASIISIVEFEAPCHRR
jgi:hypothetical protein